MDSSRTAYLGLRYFLPDELVVLIIQYKESEELRLMLNKRESEILIKNLVNKNKLRRQPDLIEFNMNKFLNTIDNKYNRPESENLGNIIRQSIIPNLTKLFENLKYVLRSFDFLEEAYKSSYEVIINNENIKDRLLIGPRQLNDKINNINEILKVFYKYGLTLSNVYFMDMNKKIKKLNSLIRSNRVLKIVTGDDYDEKRDKIFINELISLKSSSDKLPSRRSSRSITRTMSSRSGRRNRSNSYTRKARSI